MSGLSQWIIKEYDEIHQQADKPLSQEESRDLLLPGVQAYLQGLPRDMEAEARTAIDQALTKTKRRRSNSLKRDWEYILDYWDNPEESAQGVAALFELAYPLGTSQGHDKSLGKWTRSDIEAVIFGRFREAGDVMDAAMELDAVGQRVIKHLKNSGASMLEEVPAGALIPQGAAL